MYTTKFLITREHFKFRIRGTGKAYGLIAYINMLISLLCALSFLLWVAASDAKVVEKILVIVNDEIITKTELDERMSREKEMLQQLYRNDKKRLSQELEEAEKAGPELLNTMINEMLLTQEAIRKGMQVPETEIDEYIRMLKQQYGSEEVFNKALKAEGYTLDSLKQERRKALLLEELIKQEFESELKITDEDVKKFYRENKDQFPGGSDIVKLKNIFIMYHTTDADKENTRVKAENILSRCREGADFGEMAKNFSDDQLSSESGGDMGYFTPGTGEYTPELENTASKMAVGEISNLIESPIGYDIIKVTDINPPNVRAQRIYIAIRPDQEAEKAAEEKVKSALQEIQNGVDFAQVVMKYSDDLTTRDQGGDWREVPIDSMSPDLRAAFSSLNEGDISQPVKTPLGVHIFKIVQRQELTNEEMEQIRGYLQRIRLQEKLNEYSQKLKGKSYIKILADN